MAGNLGRRRSSGPSHYEPSDQLYLWLLTQPEQPVLIGELNLVRSSQGVSLRYAAEWLLRGFPLSEDLPLIDEEFLPPGKAISVGALDDARPDGWGERVIRVIDKPQRLSLLEYLYFAGEDRFGALGVSVSSEEYLPHRTGGATPTLADADLIHELVRKVQGNEPITPAQAHAVRPGAGLGGASPKTILTIDGAPWILKFAVGAAPDSPLVEHATMTLARRAEIRVAPTRAVKLQRGYAVAVRRFDRNRGRREHCLSAGVGLRAAAEPVGYPELAQLLRRRGVLTADAYVGQMRELFRRMVFNILMDNTDDHDKSQVLLLTDAQQYELAPAFGLAPAGRALGFQQMRVGEREGDATLENALSMSRLFALRRDDAVREARGVARVVDGWKEHFRACGVAPADIDSYAQWIERPALRQQRRDLKELTRV